MTFQGLLIYLLNLFAGGEVKVGPLERKNQNERDMIEVCIKKRRMLSYVYISLKGTYHEKIYIIKRYIS